MAAIRQRCMVWRVMLVTAVLACMRAASASAAKPSPGLTLHVMTAPTRFAEADNHSCFETPGVRLEELGTLAPCDQYQVTVTNSGSEPARAPIVIVDKLPGGLREPEGASEQFFLARNETKISEKESVQGETLEPCEYLEEGAKVRCEFTGELQPDQRLELDFRVKVEPGAHSGEANTVEVSEASSMVASSETQDVVTATDSTPGFGVSALVSQVTGVDGGSYSQAGGHPYEFVTRFDMNTKMGLTQEAAGALVAPTSLDLKDVVVDLPPGFVGNAQATPRCPLSQLQGIAQCPVDSIVGHLDTEPENAIAANSPVYNLVPEEGVAAELGFLDLLHGTHVIDATLVPSPEGYVLRAVSREISQLELWDALTTLYGDPAAKNGETSIPQAMFTNPAQCTGKPLVSTLYVDSWQHPGAFNPDGSPDVEGGGWTTTTSESPPVTGCEALRFNPEGFSLQPDTTKANSPTGLSFELKLPQSETPETLAAPPVRDTTVTLPAGLVPNPALAPGLAGCSEAQVGWLGKDGPHGEALANGGLTNFTQTPPTCPNESKLGTVEATTPLLEKPLTGSLYLARENENPFGSVIAGYIVFDDPVTGIVVKVPGELSLNPTTGQVTGVFKEAPQAPVSDLKLRFFGGTPGELATPESCGTFTTAGELTPWSAAEGSPPVSVSNSFQINQGCAPGFAPAFAAGTTSPQAGGYTPFELTFSRQDSEQEISGLSVTLPPGVEAKIAGVAKCPEADIQDAANNPSGASEIASPSCPAASEIGTVQTQAGVGPDPASLPGKAYLTGPYKGAPLGLAVIVPAVTGPFDLGNVVVRTALFINPSTGQVTAVSDPLPTIVDHAGANGATDGFPIRMRAVTINLNRASYVVNPTDCSPMAVNAAFTSTTGATSSASARFQVGGCGELPFKPTFTASTQGHASKAGGASLKVRITSAPGQANIGKTKVDLPKQLPSRLTTLQKACIDHVFEANPAACPEGSLVGIATAVSPLIATPFTGPAYLVSHGNAKFPDLEIVMQSEGITLILDGHTDIKKGITSSYFETLPDAPVSSFELTLPTGPHSALATFVPEKLRYNLCGQTLNMPTLITGQNNSIVKQTTHIAITGCPTKKHPAAKKKKKAHTSSKTSKHKKH
jgi:hypothetical protein